MKNKVELEIAVSKEGNLACRITSEEKLSPGVYTAVIKEAVIIKTYTLTEDQALKLYKGERDLRVKREGVVYYINEYHDEDTGKSYYEAKYWTGKIAKDVIFISEI